MKKVVLIHLMVLLGSPWAVPQMAWKWSNPQPAGNNLIHVAFDDATHGLIVADNGEVSETSDGGETWKSREGRIADDYFLTATLVDPRTILSISGFGKIWRSTNRGSTWSVVGTFSKTLFQIKSCGDGVVLAVGMGGTTIVRSDDRGATWKEVFGNTNGPYLAGIHCKGDQVFAVGDSGTILKSKDHGLHWELQPRPTFQVLTGVAFSDENHGMMATDKGLLIETRDGGKSWTSFLLDSLGYLGEISCQGPRWRVTGSNGAIWTSSNDGKIWQLTRSLISTSFSSSAFVGETGGLVVGNNGLILKEGLLGKPWRIIRTGTDLYVDGVIRFSSNEWLAFGSPGALMKTKNAGVTWSGPSKHPDSTRFLAGAFHGHLGIIAGYDGAIARSVDSGERWQSVPSPRNGIRLFGVGWRDSNTVIAVGDSGAIWRSVDAGFSWKEIQHGLDLQTLSAVCFRSDGIGFIVGYEGIILKSIDNGLSWEVIPSPNREDLFAVSFRDLQVGIAVGSNGIALTTNDAGETWIQHPLGFSDDFVLGVSWLNGDTALAVGNWEHGWFLNLTTDAGLNWTELPIPTRKKLWSITNIGKGEVVLSGQNGAILIGTLHSNAGIDINQKTTGPNKDLVWVQRLGNPNFVLLQVQIPITQIVTITCHALNGHSLGILYHGTLNQGLHTLRFPFARRGPCLFQIQGVEGKRSVSGAKILPF